MHKLELRRDRASFALYMQLPIVLLAFLGALPSCGDAPPAANDDSVVLHVSLKQDGNRLIGRLGLSGPLLARDPRSRKPSVFVRSSPPKNGSETLIVYKNSEVAEEELAELFRATTSGSGTDHAAVSLRIHSELSFTLRVKAEDHAKVVILNAREGRLISADHAFSPGAYELRIEHELKQ